MNILLIAGGWSPEREISLKGAEVLQKTMTELGHDTEIFDLLPHYDKLLNKAANFDFAFLNLHGYPGEDGHIQALLDIAGCPYQGSGPAPSFLALNKAAAKQIFRKEGLPTPDWEILPNFPSKDWEPKFSYPIFVKSNKAGSSLLLGKIGNREELDKILVEIFAKGDEALLEPEIRGKELTCAILGDKPLPPILIEPVSSDFFDFKSKYANDGAREICPAPLDKKIIQKAQSMALAVHRALGLSDYSRTDFILDETGKLHILEVNTLPGMTKNSLLPKAAKAAGIEFPQLIEKLISLGMKKKK